MTSANVALIVIDVQQGFLDPSWGSRNNPRAEANIALLIAAWRGAGHSIHHVHHASRSRTGSFWPETPGYAPKPEARPESGEPVHIKHVNSAFIGTSLEQQLRAEGVDTLVIVGLTTPHCVSTSVRMAGNLGFATYVVEDATAAFERPGLDGEMRSADDVHLTALSDLSEEFATVTKTDAVLELLAQSGFARAEHST